MKHLLFVCIAGSSLCYIACNQQGKQPTLQQRDSLARDSAAKAPLPIADYLDAEIQRLDSMPMAMLKTTVLNGRTADSNFITIAEFKALASQFQFPAFRDGSLAKDYTESDLVDRAAQTIAFTYLPVNSNSPLPLRRADVLVSRSDDGTNRVKSIYLEKNTVSGDTSVLQKMYWQAGHRFQIVSMTRIKGKAPIEQQTKVVWDASAD